MQLQLVTATVKLFLKKPTEKPQAMIQLVLTYATQETDNPDLRDRACATSHPPSSTLAQSVCLAKPRALKICWLPDFYPVAITSSIDC